MSDTIDPHQMPSHLVLDDPHKMPSHLVLDQTPEPGTMSVGGELGTNLEGIGRIGQSMGHAAVGLAGLPMDLVSSASPQTPEQVQNYMSAETGVPMPPLPADKTPPGERPPLPMSSPWIFDRLGKAGINVNPPPPTTPEQRLQDLTGDVLFNLPAMGIGSVARGASLIPKAPAAVRYLAGLGRSAVEGGVGAGVVAGAETPGDAQTRGRAALDAAETGAMVAPGLHLAGSAISRAVTPRVAVPGLGPVSESTARGAAQKFGDAIGPEGQQAVRDAAVAPATEGYSPTVAQAVANNPGAVSLEQRARANDPGGFAIKARTQANSERGAINTQAGTGDPSAVGTELQQGATALSNQGQANVSAATQARQQALGQTPATAFSDKPGGFTQNEQYGADTRASILTARKAMEDQRGALQAQINTDGNVVVPTDPIRNNLEERYTLGKYDKPPTGDEADILDALKTLPPNANLSDLQALRNRTSQTIDDLTPRDTRMGEPARRLLSVKQSIDDAIDQAASGASGTSPLIGEQRFMTPQEQGVHGQVRALNQQIAQRFDSGTTGDLLTFGDHPTNAAVAPEITRARGGFKVSDADVLPKIWDGSGNEAANIRQFTQAGGDVEKLKSFAADDLRRKAIDPVTGEFDRNGYAVWKQQHRAGLNASPELRQAFDGVERAQTTLQEATDASTAALADFNSKTVQHFIGQNPDTAVKAMFSKGNSAQNLDEILAKTGGNPSATAGLKRSVGDFIDEQYQPLSSTGGRESDLARAGKFNDFLVQHQGALLKLYGQAGYDQLGLVAKQMSSRANVSPALTVAPQAAPSPHGVTPTRLIGAELAADAIVKGLEHIPVAGHALVGTGVVVQKIVSAFRAAGIRTRGQVIDLMAREPTTVGVQMMDVLNRPASSVTPQVARRLAAAIGAAASQNQPSAAPTKPAR